jgi:cryptochrome
MSFIKYKIKKGITGFPWIDACMRQLIQEGWIHHVCRNSLAIFLTRGDLFISWEKGMNSFFKYLIDVNFENKINYS